MVGLGGGAWGGLRPAAHQADAAGTAMRLQGLGVAYRADKHCGKPFGDNSLVKF